MSSISLAPVGSTIHRRKVAILNIPGLFYILCSLSPQLAQLTIQLGLLFHILL